MATDTSQDSATPLSDADKKARTILAKALWSADNDQKFADAAERNAAFQTARKEYLGKARQLSKFLDKRGFALIEKDAG